MPGLIHGPLYVLRVICLINLTGQKQYATKLIKMNLAGHHGDSPEIISIKFWASENDFWVSTSCTVAYVQRSSTE